VGFHCPECAKAGKQRVYQGAASWTVRPIVTQVLIGINVLAYVAMVVTSALDPVSLGGKALVLQGFDKGLFADGGLVGAYAPEEPWRLVTGAFLHAPLPFGLLHIGFNMLVLLRFGQMLEPALGRARFVALYAVGLAGGTLGVVILSPLSVTVGASGAVFGLMGGALLVARERNIDLMRSGLLPTIGLNLLFTFSISFVSIGGHVGGLLGGLVGGAILTEGARRIRPRGDVVAAALTGALAVAILIVSYVLMVGEYGT
jgi:membrane associated rhomboid family serine protease